MLAICDRHRLSGALFLVGLVFLVSSQYALRDPRTQVLPLSPLLGSNLCISHLGSAPSSPSNHGNHTPQQHCPRCILGGFSDGAVGPLVAVPAPNPTALRVRYRQQPQKLHLSTVFPLLNRGPPQVA